MNSLKKVTVPCELEDIACYSFDKNNSIEEIHYTYNGKGKILDRSSSWNGENFYGYTLESAANKTLKRVIFDEGITYIGNNLFNGNLSDEDKGYIEHVQLPSTLQIIGDGAFARQEHLQSIHFYEGLKEIRFNAFSDNYSLKQLVLPATLQLIGSCTFDGCSNIEGTVIIPQNVSRIESFAFNECTSINEMIISNSDTYLGTHALFNLTSLNRITLPIDIKKEEDFVVGYSNVEEIIYTKGNTNVMKDFSSYVHSNEYYGDSLQYKFKDTLKRIIFEDGITSIGNYSFAGLQHLEGIVFPHTLTNIGEGVFNALNKDIVIGYGDKGSYGHVIVNQII